MVDLGSVIARLTGLWYRAPSASVVRERARRMRITKDAHARSCRWSVPSRRFAPRAWSSSGRGLRLWFRSRDTIGFMQSVD